MAAPPLPFVWKDGAMHPLGRVRNIAGASYGEGEIVVLAPVEERSDATHKHEFAWLKEAWLNLPPALAAEYPSVERLRKTALIRTGWCTVQDYPCGTRAEAARWARNLARELDEYSIIEVSASVVRVFRARSQARGAMGKEDFAASKTAILEWVSNLIGVEPGELQKARAA